MLNLRMEIKLQTTQYRAWSKASETSVYKPGSAGCQPALLHRQYPLSWYRQCRLSSQDGGPADFQSLVSKPAILHLKAKQQGVPAQEPFAIQYPADAAGLPPNLSYLPASGSETFELSEGLRPVKESTWTTSHS